MPQLTPEPRSLYSGWAIDTAAPQRGRSKPFARLPHGWYWTSIIDGENVVATAARCRPLDAHAAAVDAFTIEFRLQQCGLHGYELAARAGRPDGNGTFKIRMSDPLASRMPAPPRYRTSPAYSAAFTPTGMLAATEMMADAADPTFAISLFGQPGRWLVIPNWAGATAAAIALLDLHNHRSIGRAAETLLTIAT